MGSRLRIALVVSVAVVIGLCGCRKPEYVTPEGLDTPPEAAETATADPQAASIVAGLLALRPGDIKPESSEEGELGYTIVATVMSTSGPDERVRIELTPDQQILRSCKWLNDPPEGEATLSPEHAKLVAQVLFDRWYPQVPVHLAREAVQIDPTTFMVTWVARVTPDVFTGDRAWALISAVDGRPLSYSQYVPTQRPSVQDIPTKPSRAVEVAKRSLAGSADAGRKIQATRVTLILSAPQSREGDPLWFVDFIFAVPDGAQPVPPRKVAVNANTGEIEKNLLEVQ